MIGRRDIAVEEDKCVGGLIEAAMEIAQALPGQFGDYVRIAAGVLAIGRVRPELFFDQVIYLGLGA